MTKKELIAHFRNFHLPMIRDAEKISKKRNFEMRQQMWESLTTSMMTQGFISKQQKEKWVAPNFCYSRSESS